MPYWTLSFAGPLPWDELVRAAGVVLDALTAQQAEWVDEGRTPLDDPNIGSYAAFRWRLTRPDGVLSLEQEAGDGEPRDGYAYHRRFELSVPAQGLTLICNEAGYESEFRRLDLLFHSPRPADVDTIRAGLRSALGEARDRSAQADVASRNISAVMPFDEATARRWLAEAKALGPQAQGWTELLDLAAQLEGSTPELP